MRTYKEYYDLALAHHLDWLSKQDEEWWRKGNDEYLDIKGDYIETVNFISNYKKNDASLFNNHTNVKNTEWSILFDMLGQALVDWCVENVNYEDLWGMGIVMKKTIEGCSEFYECSQYVNKFDPSKQGEIFKVEDEKELKKYDGCLDFLCDLVEQFLTSHKNDIPNDWNYFSFGLDSLYVSCKYGEWVCASDGYINLGNYDEEKEEYDTFVECM